MASIVGTKGVDISYAQGNINMSKVKEAGYGWVMIRVGQGTRIIDNQFATNVEKAEKLGMPWGVYLLTEATTTAKAQAEVDFAAKLINAQIAKGYKPTLPIAIDIEEAGFSSANYTPSILTNTAKIWVDGMKKLGFYPMIYTGYYDIRDYLSKSVINSTDIWLAEWGRYPDYTESNLGLWQYGGETNLIESNSISGVGVIDKDKAYKDYPTIIKNGGYNGWAKSSGGSTTSTPTTPTKSASTTIPDVTYRVRANGKWWGEIKNDSDYAGVIGAPITDVAIKVSKGSIKYRVHVKGGNWLGWITDYNINNSATGYAGNGKVIDLIEVYYYTPSDVVKSTGYLRAKYRVSPLNGNYYDYQFDNETTNGQDGYAGDNGKAIDRLQIKLSK